MKKLQRLVLVQFFLYDAVELDIDGHVAFLGQNGSGKTSLLDAIQIAMLGGHGNYLAFNTQSVGSTGGGKRNPRSIKDYCLGVIDDTGEGGGRADRKRDNAISYITLVFEDDATREPVSIGISIRAEADDPNHEVLGLYVLPGVALRLSDHLEQSDGEEVPLLWNDFAASTRSRYHRLERTPYFTTQPTKYIQEMIHALQPKAKTIDVREYLKVFNKSVLLRNIESVDSFVRDYVVEPQSIDRRRARAQIDHFKQLSQLLEQVKKQIADLGEIASAYDEVEKYTVRSTSIKALAALYTANEHRQALADLNREIRILSRRRRLCKFAAQNFATEVKKASDERDVARDAWTSKPGAESLSTYGRMKLSSQRSLEATRQRIERDLSLIAGVVNRLVDLKAIPGHQRKIKELDQALSHHTNRFRQGLMTGIDQAVSDAIACLVSEKAAYESALTDASGKHAQADQRLSTLAGQVRNAERDGARISDEVASVINRLHQAGIKAEPVCNIVQIKEAAWQPAIEAFLKSNREALVIADGRERDAIRIIRRMPERDNPFVAKVIQPYHLRDHRWNESDSSLVGNLLVSDNPIALAYLRSVFGGMRCVETEEELERNPRALTMDGMLSANFTTSRLRFYAPDRLLFGKRLTYAEKQDLLRQLNEAMDAEKTARETKESLKGAIDRITKMGDLAEINGRVIRDLAQAIDEQSEISNVATLMSNIDSGEFAPLKEAFEKKQRALEGLQHRERENDQLLITTEATLRTQFPARTKLRQQRDEAAAVLCQIMSGPDIDESVIERVRGEIEATLAGGGHAERLAACQRRIAAADRSAEEAFVNAIQPFQRYLDHHGVALGDELKSWRLAKTWVTAELKRLKETELVERAEDVRLARYAAEEAFRNDVAVRIRESIEQMQITISDINKTLSACPAFSNGEKYRFVVKPAEAHRPIHDYIMNVGKGSERDMFALGDGAHDEIMRLLEDTSQDGKAGVNPLDDYRTLFTFDLMIDREGKKSIPLSRRLGVGSNGEHRTPFYVIAGAAMAAAYRIDSGKHSTGAGLMLLDEAFHGMDQQNALSAARFLDSIGLQMVMAAPEADHSKLAPTLDTIFEINRFDMDVFVEKTKIKEPAKVLLTSDMPSEHPELLSKMIETLEARVP